MEFNKHAPEHESWSSEPMKLAFPSMDASAWILKSKTEVNTKMSNLFMASANCATTNKGERLKTRTINRRCGPQEEPVSVIDLERGAREHP